MSEVDAEEQEVASSKATRKRKASSTKRPTPKKKPKHSDEEDYEDDNEESAQDTKVYDSDALDEDSDMETKKTKKAGTVKATKTKKSQASPRKRKRTKGDESEAEYDDLAENQEIVGMVVQAPTTGRVPPGRISQNTLDFLAHLKDPACNDREWCVVLYSSYVDRSAEPVYRLAEKEWKDFVEAFTDNLAEVDPQIPHLPPKDVVHRIYRDIRFSNDKTPYKRGFSASFSRSGRKGIFAHLKPGNESIIAGGSWCPGRSELANIRVNILRNPRRLRSVISAPEFVKHFGKPERNPKGGHQNIFGMEDELKTAPKGVFFFTHTYFQPFLDSEVLAPDFREKLAEVASVMTPFVHCLNDMMTVLDNDDDGEEEEQEEES
ncbi:hypothetical protein CPC08DRAFT_734579 [Agrocybe pediades]|nr:hypothetical protein CPC08DRAFT_734579 [Agrocybe pediades]